MTDESYDDVPEEVRAQVQATYRQAVALLAAIQNEDDEAAGAILPHEAGNELAAVLADIALEFIQSYAVEHEKSIEGVLMGVADMATRWPPSLLQCPPGECACGTDRAEDADL